MSILENVNKFGFEHNELRAMGFDRLTGEACALSMRGLYELEERTMRKYLEYTGIQVDFDLIQKSNWNNPEKYSVFLTNEQVEDVVIMMLMENFEQVVEIVPDEVYCDKAGVWAHRHLLYGNIEDIKEHLKHNAYSHYEYNDKTNKMEMTNQGFYKIGRSYTIYNHQPRKGFSNIHAFTGMSQ